MASIKSYSHVQASRHSSRGVRGSTVHDDPAYSAPHRSDVEGGMAQCSITILERLWSDLRRKRRPTETAYRPAPAFEGAPKEHDAHALRLALTSKTWHRVPDEVCAQVEVPLVYSCHADQGVGCPRRLRENMALHQQRSWQDEQLLHVNIRQRRLLGLRLVDADVVVSHILANDEDSLPCGSDQRPYGFVAYTCPLATRCESFATARNDRSHKIYSQNSNVSEAVWRPSPPIIP